MTTTSDQPESSEASSFSYVAQTFDGRATTGTIDAPSRDAAADRLAEMRLRVLDLRPAARPPRSKPLAGEDFAVFNQQLAHLSAAGLPIEAGLRLIADDLRHGGLAQSIRDVSAELEKGVPLGDAFKRHERQFPALYGVIIDAGVRAGDLPAVLLNLGRHIELVARLRAAFWRAIAYPLAVLAGLVVVLIFLRTTIVPQFQKIYHGWRIELPVVTKVLFAIADVTPAIVIIALVFFAGLPLVWSFLRMTHRETAAADLAMWVPLVGPVLRRNLIARWCDAMRLCMQIGMDLPRAVGLTSEIVGSSYTKRDGEVIVRHLESGRDISDIPGRLRLIPPTILAVIQLSADRNDLPNALQTLSTMYQQQAELRIATLQTVLTPVLILLLAGFVAFAVLGIFGPILGMFRLFS